MHTILRPRAVEGGLVRLNEVVLDGHTYSDRVHSADVAFDSGIAEIFVECLTEIPAGYAIAKDTQQPRPQPGFVPTETALLYGDFDAHRLVHPMAEGWRVAQETATPFVSLGMWEHCMDCANPALFRVPWLDLGGTRFSEIVSVSFRRATPISQADRSFYDNGGGNLIRGTAWIARVQMCGTVEIDPI